MKKQIEFDFAKWGQEGISVTVNGKNVITLHKNPNHANYFYGMTGPTLMFNNSGPCFTMFEEVKPREFWVNVYENRSVGIYETEQSAIEAFNSSRKYAPKINGQTIKVREVLD